MDDLARNFANKLQTDVNFAKDFDKVIPVYFTNLIIREYVAIFCPS